jgi:hypothetical protein
MHMADTEWRYRTGTDETGPITAEELCQRFACGALRLDVTVWCPPIQQWVSAYTIPAFRKAAASAPPSIQPVALPALSPIRPDLYDKAARAAWVTPLVALLITFCLSTAIRNANHNAPFTPGLRALVNTLMGLFVLGGLLAGVIALYGVRSSRRGRVIVPALLGVGLNGLILLAGVLSIHHGTAASAGTVSQAQLNAEAIASARDYAGWIGDARVAGGVVAVGSLDDQSPAARRVLEKFTTPCSVLAITFTNLNAPAPVRFDPRTLRLLSTQGTIDAVPLEDVLDTARADASEAISEVAAAQVLNPGSKPRTCVCFIPRGIDLHQVAAVTLLVNDQKVTVPGRFYTVEEKQQQYAKNSAVGLDAIQ